MKLRWIAVGSLFALGVALVLAPSLIGARGGEPVLRVVFFDVGQGDAIYIESPTGVQVLIDGGPDRSVLAGLGREMGFRDRTLDLIVATHEDLDHVGGLIDVFERYEVATFLRTENQGESGAADVLDSVSEAEGAEIIFARRGMRFDLGGGAALDVLFPDRDPSFLESNTASIVARLSYGDIDFLFTGDAPQSIEDHLVVLDRAGLESEVLKAGHHGSRTSTGALFLAAVRPAYAVISAGRDNRYGHPHPEVLDTLATYGVNARSTAEEGDIIFETDGRELWVK